SLTVPRVSLMTVSPPPEPEIIQRATRRLPDGGTTPCRDLSDATHAGPPPALAILGKNAAHEENVPLGPRLGQRLHPLDLNGKPAPGMTREHELGRRLRLHETHVRLGHEHLGVHAFEARDAKERVTLLQRRTTA